MVSRKLNNEDVKHIIHALFDLQYLFERVNNAYKLES